MMIDIRHNFIMVDILVEIDANMLLSLLIHQYHPSFHFTPYSFPDFFPSEVIPQFQSINNKMLHTFIISLFFRIAGDQ